MKVTVTRWRTNDIFKGPDYSPIFFVSFRSLWVIANNLVFFNFSISWTFIMWFGEGLKLQWHPLSLTAPSHHSFEFNSRHVRVPAGRQGCCVPSGLTSVMQHSSDHIDPRSGNQCNFNFRKLHVFIQLYCFCYLLKELLHSKIIIKLVDVSVS